MRKNNLIFVFGMLLCAISILAQTNYVQKTVPVKQAEKAANTSVIGQYLSFSGLGMLEMKAMFRNLPAEDRAAVMRFHIAFQLVKRPGLTADQKTLLFDGLSMITADSYSDTDTAKQAVAEAKAVSLAPRIQALFQGRERFEIFGNLGPTKDDVAILQKYEDLTPLNDLQRKAVFRKVNAAEKRDLWRVHTALYLARHFDLTASQKNFITDWLDFLTLEVFELSPKDPQWEAKVGKSLSVLTDKVLQAFSKEEAGNLVARLGEPQKEGTTISTEGLPAPEMDDCGCHRGIGDQCWGGECWGNVCRYSDYGCGFGWLLTCNGTKCT